MEWVAKQIGVSPLTLSGYEFDSRQGQSHRRVITLTILSDVEKTALYDIPNFDSLDPLVDSTNLSRLSRESLYKAIAIFC